MPRVREKNAMIGYKEKDLSAYVIGQMRINEINQIKLAKLLGCSQQTLSYKLKNYNFTFKDLLIIFDTFHTPSETILRFMEFKK